MIDSGRRSDLFRVYLLAVARCDGAVVSALGRVAPDTPESRFLVSTDSLLPSRDATGRLCRGQGDPTPCLSHPYTNLPRVITYLCFGRVTMNYPGSAEARG